MRIKRLAEGERYADNRLTLLQTPSAPQGQYSVPIKGPQAPPVEDSLLDYLAGHFPDNLPTTINVDPRQLDFLIGQQSVIAHLRALNQQQKDPSD